MSEDVGADWTKRRKLERNKRASNKLKLCLPTRTCANSASLTGSLTDPYNSPANHPHSAHNVMSDPAFIRKAKRVTACVQKIESY